MKTLNKNTKQAQQMIDNYNKSMMTSIYDAYESPSREKEKICEKWKNYAVGERGFGFEVCTASKFVFTCGFLTKDDNGRKTLHYITPTQYYKIIL